MCLTVVDGRAIGIHQFQQIDIAGAEGQCRCGVEFALDTHGVGSLHDLRDAHLLSEFDSHGVDTHSKGLLQCDICVRETAVGIVRSPCHLLTVVLNLHGEIGVQTGIARCDALVHGFGIDE